MAKEKVSPDLVVGKVSDTLLCSICKMILHDPVQTPFEHIFCRECIETFIDASEQFIHTSEAPSSDRAELRKDDLRAAPQYLKQLLQDLEVRCPEPQCGEIFQLDAFDRHHESCRMKKIVCNKGCEGELFRKDVSSHDCIKELRGVIEDLRARLEQEEKIAEKCQEISTKLQTNQQKFINCLHNLNRQVEILQSPWTARQTQCAKASGQTKNEQDRAPTRSLIASVSRGTFYLNATSKYLVSEILEIGGVEWQISVLGRSPTYYVLTCHGMVGHHSDWILSTTITVKLIRNNERLPVTLNFGRRTVTSNENSTDFLSFIKGMGTWESVAQESECLFRDGTVQVDILFEDTVLGPDMLTEGEILFDFKGVSKMENGDATLSPPATIGGVQWNLYLIKFSTTVGIRLLCNASLVKRRGVCEADYEIRVKARKGNAADCVVSVSNELFPPTRHFGEKKVNDFEFSNFVVEDTLSVAAKIKVLSFIPEIKN